ncbi:MAG: hypothetical protein ACI35R_07665 [Bacillus sp. (in: firmicutes)]
MLTLIATLSIVLHCISILAIIILYQRQNRYSETEKKMEKLRRDIEDILQSYLMEIKEENKDMAASLASSISEEPAVPQPVKETYSPREAGADGEGKIMSAPPKQAVVNAYYMKQQKKGQTNTYEPPYDAVRDQLIMTNDLERQSKEGQEGADFNQLLKERLEKQRPIDKSKTTEEMIVEMHAKGFGIEEIAKKMNKGKTEVELLLKFHGKSS